MSLIKPKINHSPTASPWPLSNLQIELLRLYSAGVSQNDLIEIKKFLADYFAKKAIKEANVYSHLAMNHL